MPPKKKGKKKGKKKKKDDAQLEIEDKYKKTMDEIEALKDHLAIRKEVARRSQSSGLEWKQRMLDTEDDLEKQKDDMKHISSDMTRQFKTMQSEMNLKIRTLEIDLERTDKQLKSTQTELRETQDTLKKTITAKDEIIKDLEFKIGEMQKIFDGILHDTLDRLLDKIEDKKKVWKDDATLIAQKNKTVLMEFGLNPLQL